MSLKIPWSETEYEFNEVMLHFEDDLYENVFALKNNKTLGATLQHRRYRNLSESTRRSYSRFLDWGLGEFLYLLKKKGDSFYLQFLNKSGDSVYCGFSIKDPIYLNRRGLYLFASSADIKYVGRCRDSFKNRINQGYGKIHPKNCYIDGQRTNCHINALIATQREKTRFWLLPMGKITQIEDSERLLIHKLDPEWNIALRRR